MLFNSYVFVGFFLPLTLAGFAAVSRLGSRAAMGWLTGASLLFYTWWTPAGLPLLLCSVLGNYVLSVLILRAGGRLRTAIAVFGVKLDYRSVRQDIGKKTGTRKRRFQMPRPLRPSDQVQGVGRSLLI